MPAFFYHDDMLLHDAGPSHPERRARVETVRNAARDQLPDAQWPPFPSARRASLVAVHTEAYVDRVLALDGKVEVLDEDTVLTEYSVRAALQAAGAAIAAVDYVLASANADFAWALTRPPGHHAEADRAMGFCVFNNVAVAAEHAISQRGVARVMIVDWDVHHGNGTQHLFEERADVLVFNTHQWPLYPGTGAHSERGRGAGAGTTVNVPVPAGFGDAEYVEIFKELLTEVARRFKPDVIFVSAGFDAHARDPLAAMRVSAAGFAAMAAIVRDLAAELCAGKLVLFLEGGYDLTGLESSFRAVLQTLAGAPPPQIEGHSRAAELIGSVRRVHGLA